jgi:hypothetical protein
MKSALLSRLFCVALLLVVYGKDTPEDGFCSAGIAEELTTALLELNALSTAAPDAGRYQELRRQTELLGALGTVAASREEAYTYAKGQTHPGVKATWFDSAQPSSAKVTASTHRKLLTMPKTAKEAEKLGWKHAERVYASVVINKAKLFGAYTGILDDAGNAAGIGSFNSSRTLFGSSVKCVDCAFADGVAVKVRLNVIRQDMTLELNEAAERGYYTGLTDEKGTPHGTGTFTELHGIKWEGTWIRGALSGKGTSFYSNGNMAYEGDWVDGKREGLGTAFLPDGKPIQQGRFERDRFRGKA